MASCSQPAARNPRPAPPPHAAATALEPAGGNSPHCVGAHAQRLPGRQGSLPPIGQRRRHSDRAAVATGQSEARDRVVGGARASI